MTIGLLFGSYSPIHNGHLEIIRQAKPDLDEVWAVIQPTNPYKPQGTPMPARLRLGLARTALENLAVAKVGKSTMRRTLESYSKKFPDNRFVLILGEDLAGSLKDWDDYEYLKTFEIRTYLRELSVSSSEIRDNLKTGQPINKLVPVSIMSQVLELYR
jgi:nicotinate-nucleotide adenylyltransferase